MAQIKTEIEIRKLETISPLQSEYDALEKEVKNVIIENGAKFSCEYGNASYVKASNRRSWDLDGLAEYAKSNKDILRFYRETPISEKVVIRTNTEMV
jgi:hypothetical protein